jgi:hypothetical protein
MEEVKKRHFVVMVKSPVLRCMEFWKSRCMAYRPFVVSSDLKKVQDCVDELCSGKDQRTAYYVEVKELE